MPPATRIIQEPRRTSSRARAPRVSRDLQLSQLLDLTYQAALDQAAWSPLLERLAHITNSDVGTLVLHDVGDPGGTAPFTFNIDLDLVAQYATWAPKNPFLIAGVSKFRAGQVITSEELIAAPEVLGSEFYNEYLRYMGVMHNTAMNLTLHGSVLEQLILLRGIGKPIHDADEVRLMQTLLPHLERAAAVRRRLESSLLERGGALDALDRLATGVLLLDRHGRVRTMNRAGQRFLDERDGLSLAIDGTLLAATGSDRSRLARMIAIATRGDPLHATAADHADGAGLRVSRPSGLPPWSLLISPLRPPEHRLRSGGSVAALFIAPPNPRIEAAATILRQLYDLTPTEARVAHLLVEGRRPPEIARLLGVQPETVRTHLRQLFLKTNTHSQLQLARLLLTGPAALVLEGESTSTAPSGATRADPSDASRRRRG